MRWTVTRDREDVTDLLRGERSLDEVADAEWRVMLAKTHEETAGKYP
jgi:hypothetical protein